MRILPTLVSELKQAHGRDAPVLALRTLLMPSA
jgi:hypothetical protein